jgi:hypothetical protein
MQANQRFSPLGAVIGRFDRLPCTLNAILSHRRLVGEGFGHVNDDKRGAVAKTDAQTKASSCEKFTLAQCFVL